jgi:hypothetical protein
MNNPMQALGFVLASSLAVSGAYATPWSGEPTPQGAAQDNVAAVSDQQVQVTTEAQTISTTNNQVTVQSVGTPAPPIWTQAFVRLTRYEPRRIYQRVGG